ncbi:MAG: NAD(P)H-dependent oxidoreductase subunit E [Lachnospirales bacterium]
MGLSTEVKEKIILKNNSDPHRILNMLVDIQFTSEEGYIDEETAELVAKKLHMPVTRVYELLSFYAILKTEPQARYVFKICNSAPCQFTGGGTLIDVLKEELGVDVDEPTADGLFMFHGIPCMGACDEGPSIKIKDTIFPHLTKEKVVELINDLKNGRYSEL